MRKNSYKIIFVFFSIIAIGASCKSESAPAEKTRDEKITEIIENMKKNPEWMQALQQKSIDWGKPLDSVMYIDAVWMLDQEGK
jgi:hypothetical protein